MNSRKNSNVSSCKPRVSTESRDDLGKLYIVNRFYNVRCHGAQKSPCWNYFGFLFYDAGKNKIICLFIQHNNL
jgi:hypothetical protein